VVLDSLRDLIRYDDAAPAIVVSGLTETFRLYHERPMGLKERLYRFRRSTYEDFEALSDVTFQVERGETVGIIGHNGSGKSTLLKVLARILPPDDGRVQINGRVASLLELGAGMHGDLSGRENIYLNGAILGLTKAEIDDRFDAIVDFAGVRPFLDTAVRNYSSGMYVRLGFAIAVNVDPDILLVDEVLSVGDSQFQAKSLERMQRFKDRGKTIVIVSHDLGAVQELCERTIVLHRGEVVFDGPAGEGVAQYAQLMGMARAGDERGDDGSFGSGKVRIDDVLLLDAHGTQVGTVAPSTQLRLRVRVSAREDVPACSVGAVVRGNQGDLYEVHTTWQGLGVGPLRAGDSAVVDIRFTAHLLAGRFWITPLVTDPSVREQHAILPDEVEIEVTPAPGGIGLVDMVASTSVTEGPALTLGGAETTGPIPVLRPEDDEDGTARATGS
jgi:ABC-type polysaccharide/polyol phosphate transport system ATPase subunit